MILAVTEQYHDYQPQNYFLDSSKLDPKNAVDLRILDRIKSNKLIVKVHIDATNWETDPSFNGEEPCVSEAAKVKRKDVSKIDKTVNLSIYFDC